MIESIIFFLKAEDGIRDLVRSRGLGVVYKRQGHESQALGRRARLQAVHRAELRDEAVDASGDERPGRRFVGPRQVADCLLYTSDPAGERSSVDLGGRRIIKKKNNNRTKSILNNGTKSRNTDAVWMSLWC